ncbi:excalibur calcium-binding domain-containing protein [Nocardia sp. NPDC059691]|uniref:excalibur calcium-binding domain-containing protein n=1 Tax=Nocardia sp. NPDC059691 TaxID=3346908 RepID=UPI0036D1120F
MRRRTSGTTLPRSPFEGGQNDTPGTAANSAAAEQSTGPEQSAAAEQPATASAPGSLLQELHGGPHAGKAPLRRGQPGYAPHLDRDNDGIACE